MAARTPVSRETSRENQRETKRVAGPMPTDFGRGFDSRRLHHFNVSKNGPDESNSGQPTAEVGHPQELTPTPRDVSRTGHGQVGSSSGLGPNVTGTQRQDGE